MPARHTNKPSTQLTSTQHPPAQHTDLFAIGSQRSAPSRQRLAPLPPTLAPPTLAPPTLAHSNTPAPAHLNLRGPTSAATGPVPEIQCRRQGPRAEPAPERPVPSCATSVVLYRSGRAGRAGAGLAPVTWAYHRARHVARRLYACPSRCARHAARPLVLTLCLLRRYLLMSQRPSTGSAEVGPGRSPARGGTPRLGRRRQPSRSQ